MAVNPLISGRAPGYWGRDIRCRIQSELIPDKVLSLNLDKVEAMGVPFALWREADSFLSNLETCSCFKDTAKQPDIPCQTCYGTGKIPGYIKFGTQNYWVASIDSGWTLNNLILDTNNRPNRLMLANNQLTGTAISPFIPVSLANKVGPWEFKAEAFTRDGGSNSAVTVEVSVNAGNTWYPLSALESILTNTNMPSLPLMMGGGLPYVNMPSLPLLLQQPPSLGIQFRVTMVRGSVQTKSPMFEIIRVRFPTMTDIATVNPLNEPVIRCIPTWLSEAEIKQLWGSKFESEGRRFWTVPLPFFDNSIPRETVAARIQDDAIVEVRYGGEIGFRYRLIQFNYSDTFGEFTRQEFGLRKFAGTPGAIQGEFAYRMF